MWRNVVQRLLLALPVLLGVLLLGFVLMQVVPNDPAVVRAGPTATMEVIEAIRRDLGLDKPLVVQFGLYLSRLLRGDLGISNINTPLGCITRKATTSPGCATAGPASRIARSCSRDVASR